MDNIFLDRLVSDSDFLVMSSAVRHQKILILLTQNIPIEGLAIRTSDAFALVLVVLLSIALLVYVQGYVNELQSNDNVLATTKHLVSFIPTLLVVGILAMSGYGIYSSVKKKR